MAVCSEMQKHVHAGHFQFLDEQSILQRSVCNNGLVLDKAVRDISLVRLPASSACSASADAAWGSCCPSPELKAAYTCAGSGLLDAAACESLDQTALMSRQAAVLGLLDPAAPQQAGLSPRQGPSGVLHAGRSGDMGRNNGQTASGGLDSSVHPCTCV